MALPGRSCRPADVNVIFEDAWGIQRVAGCGLCARRLGDVEYISALKPFQNKQVASVELKSDCGNKTLLAGNMGITPPVTSRGNERLAAAR